MTRRLLLFALALAPGVAGFDEHKMKKCADNSFCRHHRAFAAEPGSSPEARGGAYTADASTLSLDAEGVRLLVASDRHKVPLELRISALPGGLTARMRLRELHPLRQRFDAPHVLLDGAHATTPLSVLRKEAGGVTLSLGQGQGAGQLQIEYAPLRLRFFAPLVGGVDGEVVEVATFNARGLLEYEHYRAKPAPKPALEEPAATSELAEGTEREGAEEAVDAASANDGQPKAESTAALDEPEQAAGTEEGQGTKGGGWEDDLVWEETFQTHKDTRPFGPAAIGLDWSLPAFEHIYGLPERAAPLNLKDTRGEGAYAEPYRLYNLDVFEYVTDSPFGLYGAVPLVWAHRAASGAGTAGAAAGRGQNVALFWPNPSEMYVDVFRTSSAGQPARTADKGGAPLAAGGGGGGERAVQTHWVAESGSLDFFVLLGPSALAISRQYAALTGGTQLPPLFALGYHQCRWNYNDEQDVLSLDQKFEELDFPYDVLWLDIEYTDGKRYFTWDSRKFPEPVAMLDTLSAKGHKMVLILDPHIKVDDNYHVYSEAKALGHFVRTHSNGTFDGWCWPGTSSYLDFLSPAARDFWASKLQLQSFTLSTHAAHIWNDMNEPSVFNGPEVTMHKDCLHAGGTVEHRELHNMYGHLHAMATHQGLLQRETLGPLGSQRGRTFILTRSFFAGSQRVAAVWTGDNMAKWEHLAASVPMLLALSISGIAFCGADVGGFFYNPDVELLVRWYQAGAYQPFFRAHAHIETKRREPWLFGEPYLSRMREAVRERYRLLPYIYTLAAAAALEGTPIMRPLWFEFEADAETFGQEDAFLLGGALLVQPVVTAGQTSASLRLPGGPQQKWYDAHTLAHAGDGGSTVSLPTPAEQIPVLYRGGSIVPRKERLRRASSRMAHDPYTLLVAPDSAGSASGELYIDDGESHGFEDGEFIWRSLSLSHSRLTCSRSAARPAGIAEAAAKVPAIGAAVERIVVLAVATAPARVTISLAGGVPRELSFTHDPVGQVLVVRKPDVPVSADWELSMH